MISPIGETKANNGFTLIEILLVLIITGIILALAAPNFSKGYARFQLNQTADDLLGLSRWGQAMAIGQECIYALSFSEDRRSYGLVRAASGPQANDQENFEPVKGTLGRMRAIPDAIRLETHDDHIDFYPDGTIDVTTINLSSQDQKEILSSAQVRGMMTKIDNE